MSGPDDSLTEPDWTDPEWSGSDAGPAPRRARRTRRAPVEPVRGRTAALVAVLATVVVVAGIAAAVGTSTPAPAPSVADGVAVTPVGAYSSSAFCVAGTGTTAPTHRLPDQLDPLGGGRGHDVGRLLRGVAGRCPPCAAG